MSEVMVKWREVIVYQEPQQTLSRIGQKVVLSTPSRLEEQFQVLSSMLYFTRGGMYDSVKHYSCKEVLISEKIYRILEVGVWV